MCRYRITRSGRFVDWDGNDLELSGYVTFHALRKGMVTTDDARELVEYRARFRDGNLDSIVRVATGEPSEIRYGVASYRWFAPRSFMFGDDADAAAPV